MDKTNKSNKTLVIILAIVALAVVGGLIIVMTNISDNNSSQKPKEVTAEDIITRANLQNEEAVAGQVKAKLDIYYSKYNSYPTKVEDAATVPESLKGFSYQSDGKQFTFTYTSSVDGQVKTVTNNSRI